MYSLDVDRISVRRELFMGWPRGVSGGSPRGRRIFEKGEYTCTFETVPIVLNGISIWRISKCRFTESWLTVGYIIYFIFLNFLFPVPTFTFYLVSSYKYRTRKPFSNVRIIARKILGDGISKIGSDQGNVNNYVNSEISYVLGIVTGSIPQFLRIKKLEFVMQRALIYTDAPTPR